MIPTDERQQCHLLAKPGSVDCWLKLRHDNVQPVQDMSTPINSPIAPPNIRFFFNVHTYNPDSFGPPMVCHIGKSPAAYLSMFVYFVLKVVLFMIVRIWSLVGVFRPIIAIYSL